MCRTVQCGRLLGTTDDIGGPGQNSGHLLFQVHLELLHLLLQALTLTLYVLLPLRQVCKSLEIVAHSLEALAHEETCLPRPRGNGLAAHVGVKFCLRQVQALSREVLDELEAATQVGEEVTLLP